MFKSVNYKENLFEIQKEIYSNNLLYDSIITITNTSDDGDIDDDGVMVADEIAKNAITNKQYKVHKAILSICSKYFENLFKIINDDQPYEHIINIIIPDISPIIMDSILEFLYCGEILIKTSELFSEFLNWCNFFQINSFVEMNKSSEIKIDINKSITIININQYDNNLINSCEVDNVIALFNSSESSNFDATRIKTSSDNSNNEKLGVDNNSIQIKSFEFTNEVIYEMIDVDEQNYVQDESNSIKKDNCSEYDDNITYDNIINFINYDNKNDDDDECNLNEALKFDNILTNNEIKDQTIHKTRQIKSYSEHTLEKALNELKSGNSINNISKEYNIPKSTLYLRIRQNPELEHLHRPVHYPNINAALQSVTGDEKLTIHKASIKYSIPQTILWRKLKKCKEYTPELKKQFDSKFANAMNALKNGDSLKSTSLKYHIPLATLHRYRVKLYREGKLPENCHVKQLKRSSDYLERVQSALDSCRLGMTQHQASALYNIPKSTLWRYLHNVKRNNSVKM